MHLFEIIAEQEVVGFLLDLTPEDRARADFRASLLAEKGPELTMPHSRYLRDGVRELRFEISGNRNVRITYWFPGDRKIILLTVFTKSTQHETIEVNRAILAKKLCENDHDPTYHNVFET
ncbi:type II toxin-antitoxin system RelE/ParE family toxin [Nocardia takedensis]|uniref:type II toxin-antitoxin system RelE/ParE family toxin n=1 Tax=Nocardia takedensis TaxID=259390 RepID=UPI0002F2E42A|nr:type II toxin-antitoxin system RelE/ParE family toxin [Nocardia takedensis]